jgi:hypothetical protein
VIRGFVVAAVVLGLSTALHAEDRPDVVESASIQAQADALHDAVANSSLSGFDLHAQAAGMADDLPRQTPYMRPVARFMDRERVDGHTGTIDGMVDEAQRRWDAYKAQAKEVPDARLDAAIAYARQFRDAKKIAWDAQLPENQMAEFLYAKDKRDDGVIKLNARLALMAKRIGEAFCYAALVHQAAHAKSRAEGRLDEKHSLDDELEAYGVQYQWLKAVDPRAERMIVLHSTLKIYLKDHPEDRITRLTVGYLEHLIGLWDTHGDERALREFIRGLGYIQGGVDPAASKIRV